MLDRFLTVPQSIFDFTIMSSDKKQRWIPLESNPEVLNKYIHGLGVPQKWQFNDVFGLDVELLNMVPKPVIAVTMLFPITENSEDEKNKLGEEKQDANDVYYMKQTVGNACGTVAVIHSLANNKDVIGFESNCHFKKFLDETMNKGPDEKATILEEDEAMGSAHEDIAQEGQTEAPSRDEKVSTHFIAFVHKDGGLYELDGRKTCPIYHGETSADSLLEKTVNVVKKFMERDPDQLNFTLMALSDVSAS